jgi:hypothetical protein
MFESNAYNSFFSVDILGRDPENIPLEKLKTQPMM